MSVQVLLSRFASAIDDHRWDDLAELLHAEFSCHLVHTGETFDRDELVTMNREYPGFQRFLLRDVIAAETRAAGRAHVTGLTDGEVQHFEVASFLTMRDGLIADLTEVWTEVGLEPPTGARPPSE